MRSTGQIAASAAFAIALMLVASTLPASAAVSCTFSSVSGVNFGAYDVFSGTTNTANGSLTVTCSGGTATATVTLSKGNSGSYATRYMLHGASQLDYNLYLDPFGFFIWGDGSAGTLDWGNVSITGSETLTVFGRLPAGQDVPAGSYSDTITATVSY